MISTAFLALSLLSAAPAPADTNLLANPGFEQSVEGKNLPAKWNANPQAFSLAAGAGRNGTMALKCVNDDPNRYPFCTQPIDARPGRKYRFSAWIKTDKIVGDESGATIALEWSDKAGKWLGGAYVNGVKGTKDWTQVTGMTRIPENAVNVRLHCYLRRGMTGTAWFDDLEAVREVDPVMETMVVAPVYRGWITADGPEKVRVVVRLNRRDYDFSSARHALAAKFDGRDFLLVTIEDQETLDVEFPSKTIRPGKHQLELQLTRAGAAQPLGVATHEITRQPADFAPKCRIDEQRRLLVNNRPFFPIGLYCSQIKEDDLKLFQTSKINCLMPYGSPTAAQMDLAAKYGIKVIYSVKDFYAGSTWAPKSLKTEADEEALIRSRVKQFRDHPALLAWYLNDELPQTYMPRLEAHQRWVAEDDPHHPTWVVLYQYREVSAYRNTFDVIGTDPYPIGRLPASTAAVWTAETLRQVQRARPLWQVPQLHNWANYEKQKTPNPKLHTPSYDELRSMAWQCITEGGMGLIFYSWGDVRRNPDVPFDVQWSGIQRIAAEIDRFAPILLSTDAPPDVRPNSAGPWRHWLARSVGKKGYLLVVNDGDGAGPIRFWLPDGVKRAKELTTARSIALKAGELVDELPKLQLRVYEFE